MAPGFSEKLRRFKRPGNLDDALDSRTAKPLEHERRCAKVCESALSKSFARLEMNAKVCERCAKVRENARRCEASPGLARARPASPDEGPRAFAKEMDFLFFKSEHEIVGTRTSNLFLRTFLYAPVKTCADLERS